MILDRSTNTEGFSINFFTMSKSVYIINHFIPIIYWNLWQWSSSTNLRSFILWNEIFYSLLSYWSHVDLGHIDLPSLTIFVMRNIFNIIARKSDSLAKPNSRLLRFFSGIVTQEKCINFFCDNSIFL